MKKKIFWITLVTLLILCYSLVSIFFQTAGNSDKEKIVSIPKGYNANQIASLLYQSKIIKNEIFFKLTLLMAGQQNNLQAGRYLLSPSMTNLEIISLLKKGQIAPPQPLKVTFPEGTSIYKMGKILEKYGYPYSQEFSNLTNVAMGENLIIKYPFLREIRENSLEGYLFPDTYIFEKDLKLEQLTQLMLRRFDEVVFTYWKKHNSSTKYNLRQIITLASIIEKEAQKPNERAIISSVYHNRLNIRMALDACPTIKYALNDPTKKVLKWQLNVKSPYNTYRNRGLPPGPICNPGIKSIKAAIYPAKTKYFYFVAKKDGSHIFSKTLKEHNRAKRSIPTQ